MKFEVGRILAPAAVWLVLSALGEVRAQVEGRAATLETDKDDVARADELFRSGKELLNRGSYAEACPVLADSYRLDPATGSLLALALCHERNGKLASAFREYREVAVRAEAERTPEREKAATARANELESRLSCVSIEASACAQLSGCIVRIQGEAIEAARFGSALPWDGGLISVEATAPGKLSFMQDFALANEGEHKIIGIPQLADAPVLSALPEPQATASATLRSSRAEARKPKAERVQAPQKNATLTWLGVGLMAGGATSAAVGLGYSLRALLKNNDSDRNCVADVCDARGREDRLSARRAGNIATATLVIGVGLTGSGLAMYFRGKRVRDVHPGVVARETSAPRAIAGLSALPWASRGGAGLALGGRF